MKVTLGSITIRELKWIVEQEHKWPIYSKFGTINKYCSMRLPRNKTEQNKQIKCKKNKKQNKTKKADIERIRFKCRFLLFQDRNNQI